MKFPDNSWYIGTWVDGKMHGNGAFVWELVKNDEKKQEKYDGDYFQGKKQGKGKFYFVSGNYYEGDWMNGKMEGEGIMYDKEGKVLKDGIWKNGTYVQPKSTIYENQSNIRSPIE